MKTIEEFFEEIEHDTPRRVVIKGTPRYVVIAKAVNNKPLYKTKDIRWSPDLKKAQKYKTFEGAQRFAVSYQRKVKELNVNDIFISVKGLHEL